MSVLACVKFLFGVSRFACQCIAGVRIRDKVKKERYCTYLKLLLVWKLSAGRMDECPDRRLVTRLVFSCGGVEGCKLVRTIVGSCGML